MKRAPVVIVAGLLALALLVAWAFPRLFHEVPVDLPQPLTGEAAYNPLYALKLALQAQRQPVSAWANLAAAEHALAPGDSLLLFDRPEAMTEAQARRLLDWVRRGGHLLMPGPPSGAEPGPLAKQLGLGAYAEPGDKEAKDGKDADADAGPLPDCDALRLPGQPADGDGPMLCDPRFVATQAGYTLAGGDPERGYRFARGALGAGSVTVTELDYLDNERLRSPAARAMAFQLLAPGLGRGRVHLVYSADVPSLFRLLLRHGWRALLPLALALAAWLLWRGQRFGPVLPVPPPRRRALLEHVQASGEFAFRRHRGAALHAAVLRLFRQRLQRREPALAVLDGEALVQALVAALGQPASRVRQALSPQGLHHPATFTQSIATLLQMRSKL